MRKQIDVMPLVEVVDALLAPDGCPWDRAQSHESMRKHLIEEAYEVCDAIDCKDMDNLREELGDVLFQVVFHAALAEEEEQFDLQGVIDEVVTKMKRRHPRIYPPADGAEALMDWESIKRAEKTMKKQKMTLPEGLPVLIKLDKLIGKLEEKGLSTEDIINFCENESERKLLKSVYCYREESRPIELSAKNFADRMEAQLMDIQE